MADLCQSLASAEAAYENKNSVKQPLNDIGYEDLQSRSRIKEQRLEEVCKLVQEQAETIAQLKAQLRENLEHIQDTDRLVEVNRYLEEELQMLKASQCKTLSEDGSKASGVGRAMSLQTQVQKLQDKCRNLEAENVKLKSVGLTTADADLARQQASRYESLLDENMLLKEKNDRLTAKNNQLENEAMRLRDRCGELEELLSDEEQDINEVLQLIRQVSAVPVATIDPGPMNPSKVVSVPIQLHQ